MVVAFWANYASLIYVQSKQKVKLTGCSLTGDSCEGHVSPWVFIWLAAGKLLVQRFLMRWYNIVVRDSAICFDTFSRALKAGYVDGGPSLGLITVQISRRGMMRTLMNLVVMTPPV